MPSVGTPAGFFLFLFLFSNEWALCIKWPKYWSFNFSISPSNEYSGLISFRIDWFDFPTVQGILKNLLQHHSSKASILWCCFPGGASGKAPACNAGDIRDAVSIPGLGRSPGEGTDNPLQYFCLGNPMYRETWQAVVHRVTKSWTLLKRLGTHARSFLYGSALTSIHDHRKKHSFDYTDFCWQSDVSAF